MAWQLTTPISVGDLDAADYPYVKVRRMYWDDDRQMINVEWSYGTIDGEGNFVEGKVPHGAKINYIFEGAEYTDLVSHVSNNGELTYAAVKRGLYEALLAKSLIPAGSIV